MKFSVLFTVLAFSLLSFVTMLHIKTDVARLYDEREYLLDQQLTFRDSMKVQQAELAHLTGPDRLEYFADLAGMSTIEANQISPMQASYILGGRL
ncbi:MAG: hypothetical protein ACI9TY_000207 [Alphaproteobacteria bacterium]